jgi:hypothetical protein
MSAAFRPIRPALFAWEDIDDGAWLDPDVIEIYESRGTAVAVEPASDQNATVGLSDRLCRGY